MEVLAGSKNKSYIVFLVLLVFSVTASAGANWLNHGGDRYNRRYAAQEVKISPETVSNLTLKWEFVAGMDITATPAIFGGTVYFPSWNGNVYAVKAVDGSLVWEINMSNITGFEGTGFVSGANYTLSRTTPVIAGNLVLIGIYGPSVVIAVNRFTGKLVWSTQLDNHTDSVITMSGTIFKGGYYVGVSSVEEGTSVEDCCIFRGSMVKLDVRTGAILWKTYTLPDNFGELGGYAGAALWGSSPSMDIKRNLVYVATGNLYTAPKHIQECQERENNQTVPSSTDECIEPENHGNSILAFDLDSGDLKWYRQLGGYDVWIFQCSDLSTPGCPPGPNPDADFGEAPMMLTAVVNGTRRDIVVAVQKSGIAWALDRDTGSIIWSTTAGPGGFVGGGTWGAATDTVRVYTNIVNNAQENVTLYPSNQTTTAGVWVAMNATTGNVLWRTANPKNATAGGPVTVANEVLFAGSDDSEGAVYAMDAETGEILWSYDTGASVHGGMSVSDGCIYVGNGYAVNLGVLFGTTAGTSLFAFCIS